MYSCDISFTLDAVRTRLPLFFQLELDTDFPSAPDWHGHLGSGSGISTTTNAVTMLP
jgi:hypothetical protein